MEGASPKMMWVYPLSMQIVADSSKTTPISLSNDAESGLCIVYDGSQPSLPSTPLRSHIPECFSRNTGDGDEPFEPDETEYPGASAIHDIVNKLVDGEDHILGEHR